MKIKLLVLTLLFSAMSWGQITQPLAWTKAYDQGTLTATGTNFSIATGSNRVLVVAIATSFTSTGGSSGTQADPATITYGGVTLTRAIGNGTTNGRTHTWLYYLKDNVVMDGTSRPINVTGGAVTSATLANMTVWYGVYAGVDQAPASYTVGNGFSNSTGPAQLSAAMTVNVNEQAVYISSIYNDAAVVVPSYTINANWTSGGTNSGTNGGTIAWKDEVANRTIPIANTTDNALTTTISPVNANLRYAMSAMSLPKAIVLPPTITSFTPTSGCASTTSVVITGTNFTGATVVKFGGTNALSFTVNSATQITATPATGTTGTIAVTTGGGTATSSGTFTVNALPVLSLTASSTICSGSATTRSITSSVSGTTYSWSSAITTVPSGGTITGMIDQATPIALSTTLPNFSQTLVNTGTTAGVVRFTFTPYANGCTGTTAITDITVNPAPTVTLSSNALSNTTCVNTAVIYTTQAGFSSYTWTFPAGYVAGTDYTIISGGTSTDNTITLKWLLPSGSRTVRVNYYNSFGCNAATFTSLVTAVNATPAAPTISQTNPTCAVPTGTITITAVTGETYSFDGSAYSGTLVYSNLAQGSSHTVYAKNASGCISLVTNATITSLATNIWTTTPTSSWSLGTPTINQNIDFQGNYTSAGNVSGCSCQVTSGVITISSGDTMTITNGVTVAGGSLIFNNNASLVQTTNATNTGNITYKRISSPMNNFDYTYWCSPVAGQVLNVLSPNTLSDKYFSFAAGNWVYESGGNTMDPVGKGFIIRTPKDNGGVAWPNGELVAFPYSQPVSFIGVPYNGNKSIASQGANAYNLIGNPYPSALDADLFMTDTNNSTIIDGGLYFWTHNTPIAQSGSNYIYTSNDYATYTLTGGVGTGVAGGASPAPGRYIGAGQSFFVASKLAGSFNFTNTMRVSGSNTQFYRMSNSKTAKNAIAPIEKNRVWLNLTNTQGAFKQTLLGYVTGATNIWDNLYDAESFNGNSFIDFYSVLDAKNLVIQGRALPFDTADIVPLGYSTTIVGDFSIAIDQADGLLANQDVFIEDKLTNTVTNIKGGSYTFATAAGTFNDRFILSFTNKSLATTSFDAIENKVLVASKNKQIRITSLAEPLDKVMVYDLLGRKIYQKTGLLSNELVINNLVSGQQQVLIVKTSLRDGQVVSKKIVY